MTNDHGWAPLGHVKSVGGLDVRPGSFSMSIGPSVDHPCACPATVCARRATQEDGLCDECRDTCRNAEKHTPA